MLLAACAPVAAQTGSLAPDSLVFTSRTVTTTSAPQIITVANTGTTPFLIHAFFLDNPLRFSIAAGGSCGVPSQQAPLTLVAGQSCTVPVTFRPDTPGNHAGNFEVSSTVPQTSFTPQRVSMSGSGTAIPATLAPDALTFAPQTVTTTSAAQLITIANAGDAAFAVNGFFIDNPSRFTVVAGGSCGVPTPQAPVILQTGQSCIVPIGFRPDTAGAHNGNFTVSSTSPATTLTPLRVAMSGTGTAVPATLSPAALTFPPQTVGSTSTPQTLTVANVGTASITLTNFFIDNPLRFTAVAGGSCGTPSFQTPTVVAAGQSCTVLIAFRPDNPPGAHGGSFQLTGTTPATIFTPGSVTLGGSGTAVPIVLAPDLLDFGEVPAFATSPAQTIAIGNAAAGGSVTIQSVALSNPRFALAPGGSCGSPPFALAGGADCTLAVVFQPQQFDQPQSGTFSIATTSPNSTVTPPNLALQGVGGPALVFADGFETP